jgi:PKHD-type hydroxylase
MLRGLAVLLAIPQVLSKEQVRHCRQVMDAAEWIDGRGTAGPQSGWSSTTCNCPRPRPPPSSSAA